MKKCLIILVFLVSFIGFSQDNHIVKTEDGRRVLLKTDFTWKYIDLEIPTKNETTPPTLKPINKNACSIKDGFEEPKLDRKIQAQLKKGRATMDHVKKKVAKDYDCEINEIILLSVSEQKAKAVYRFCAHGTKATYKRIGNSIIKAPKLF